jgi:hypothetical protein
VAWLGRAHSLALAGTGVIHLFKTDITQADHTEVRVVAQGLSTVELGVTRRTAPDRTSWTRLTPIRRASGWIEYGGRVPCDDDRIARISLRTSGSGHLGKVLLADAQSLYKTPARPRSFAVADEGHGAGTTRHLSFTWSRRPDATAYDVLQGNRWLGRVHRDAFFAESVDLSKGRTFQLVPIAPNGNRGPSAGTHL